MKALGRNDPCSCGSGRKYKHCCLPKEAIASDSSSSLPNLVQSAIDAHRAGRLTEAEAFYNAALRLDARQPALHYHLGLISGDQGRWEEAVTHYQRALGLDPNFPEALNNLGHACNRLSRWTEAVPYLRQALLIRPRYALAHNNLGIALDQLGRSEEAVACYRESISDDPGFAEAHYNLGTALLIHGQIDQAIAALERATALRPDYALAHLNLGNARLLLGDLGQARTHIDRALALAPDLPSAHDSSLFLSAYLPPSDETVAAAYRRYAERFEAPRRAEWRPHSNPRNPDRRLKIGYLSADLRVHSVASFIEPILAHHDGEAFEVYAYYNSGISDATSGRLRTYVDGWLPCKPLSDQQLADRIRADGIDILIDLSGHSTGNRLPVFACKPAPVQVTYLGYPATTGLTAIDFRLVTEDTDPSGAEQFHSERLWRLPRSLWCYRPSLGMPPPRAHTPARDRGYVCFGSTNNVAKVSDQAIAVWARLLRAVPSARLIMTNLAEGAAQALVRARFAREGIDSARLDLHGKLDTVEFYSRLGEVDIALDPFPYNGTTTSCESLWMGVPMVTLRGERSAGRSGYALLRMVGTPELIADSEEAYVRLAAGLAGDLERLDAMHASMRPRMAASALRDEAGVTRDIEAAYRAMWRSWCEHGPRDRT